MFAFFFFFFTSAHQIFTHNSFSKRERRKER
jgi:hypothetical protein